MRRLVFGLGSLLAATGLVAAVSVSVSSAFTPLVGVDWASGEQTFVYRCASCHSVAESRVEDYGPNLSRIAEDAATRIPGMSAEQYLIQSIVDPNAYRRPGLSEVMPARASAGMTREQVLSVVGYLMSLRGRPDYRRLAALIDTIRVPAATELVSVSPLEAEAGRQLFLERCNTCHSLRRLPGADLRAPVLVGTGNHDLAYLTDSLRDPSKVIVRGYERWTVSLRSGETYTGRLMRDTVDEVVLLVDSPSGAPEPVTIARRDIAVDDQGRPGMEASKVSAMPVDLLSESETRRMVTFLRTL